MASTIEQHLKKDREYLQSMSMHKKLEEFVVAALKVKPSNVYEYMHEWSGEKTGCNCVGGVAGKKPSAADKAAASRNVEAAPADVDSCRAPTPKIAAPEPSTDDAATPSSGLLNDDAARDAAARTIQRAQRQRAARAYRAKLYGVRADEMRNLEEAAIQQEKELERLEAEIEKIDNDNNKDASKHNSNNASAANSTNQPTPPALELSNVAEGMSEDDAALKIQSARRQRVARIDAENRRIEQAERDLENDALAKEQAMKEEGLTEDQAAAKIQSIQRARQARREVEALREEKAALDAAADKEEESKAIEEAEEGGLTEDQAALKIQSMHRMKAAKREAEERRLATIEAEKAKEQAAADFAEESQLKEEAEKEGLTEDQAAAKIQSLQRARQARREVEKLRQEKASLEAEIAAKVEDQVKENAKEDGLTEDQAAAKIQSLHRAREARREVEKIRQAKAAQDAAADKAEDAQVLDNAEKEGLTEDQAAAKIQSIQRARIARREVEAMKARKEAEAADANVAEAAVEAPPVGDAYEEEEEL